MVVALERSRLRVYEKGRQGVQQRLAGVDLGEQELAASGVYPNLLRLSLGIEHIDDIKEDLNEALKHL